MRWGKVGWGGPGMGLGRKGRDSRWGGGGVVLGLLTGEGSLWS